MICSVYYRPFIVLIFPRLGSSLTTRPSVTCLDGIHLAYLQKQRSMAGKGGADGESADERVHDGLPDSRRGDTARLHSSSRNGPPVVTTSASDIHRRYRWTTHAPSLLIAGLGDLLTPPYLAPAVADGFSEVELKIWDEGGAFPIS